MSSESELSTSTTAEAAPQASPEATTTPTQQTNAPLIGGPQTTAEPTAWAEYVADPNKTPDENAAAKADHDKTKPAAEAKTEAPKVEPLTVADVKLPEGFSVDEPVMNEFLGLINDPALSPKDRAQKLVDLQIKSFTQASERASSAWESLQTERQQEWAADPDIGGPKQAKVAEDANKLLGQYGSPELANLIGESGVGNSVHFARFMAQIAPFLLEGKPVNPSAPSGQNGYSTNNLYPTQ